MLFPISFAILGTAHNGTIGEIYVNISYMFWGQNEIETDTCPGEAFNDSCSSTRSV